MKESTGIALCIVFICCLICFIGWVSGESLTDQKWQAECVKRDFAEYNQKTGEWQWKAESEK